MAGRLPRTDRHRQRHSARVRVCVREVRHGGGTRSCWNAAEVRQREGIRRRHRIRGGGFRRRTGLRGNRRGVADRGDYVVLHRLAVADGEKGRGVAAEFMRRTEALARERGVGSFRVDTNFDNRYMLRMLERLGFAYCGKIVYGSGERLAFEKPFEA